MAVTHACAFFARGAGAKAPQRRAGSAVAGLGDGTGSSGLPPTIAEETGKGQGHGDALQRLIKKAERRQQHLGRLFLEIVRST